MKRHYLRFAFFAAWLCSVPLAADDGIFDQYRDLMGDDNPAVFVIDEGEELWFTPQGPESATLEACDLGLGPGVIAGAYVRFPRFGLVCVTMNPRWTRHGILLKHGQGRPEKNLESKPQVKACIPKSVILK